ncbi:hypothetical protein WJX82_004550 [Trebouxia sp. C0006]
MGSTQNCGLHFSVVASRLATQGVQQAHLASCVQQSLVDATAFMATVGTQLTAFAPHYNDCPSLQHSGSSSPAQLALFANPLQDTISMLHEGLAVSPTVNQSHVGFLGVATPS